MLTVEFNQQLNRVEIRADREGIRFLRRKLKKARKTKEEIRIEGKLGADQIGMNTIVAKEVLLSFHKPSPAADANSEGGESDANLNGHAEGGKEKKKGKDKSKSSSTKKKQSK